MQILIKQPHLEKLPKGEKWRLTIHLEIEKGESHTLWYEIPSTFVDYLSTEVADTFVVAYLLYAMQHKYDIISERPVSSHLLAMLNEYLIPFLSGINKSLYPVKVIAQEYTGTFNGNHCGTGISCGVDSLSTVIYHGMEEQVSSRRIDTLTLLNTGYYGHNEGNSEHYQSYVSQSAQFCKKFGYAFLTVDSNVSNLTQYDFLSAHTYLTCSTLLLFQKYFHTYYYASGYPVFNFEPNFKDPAYYDTFLLNCISTASLDFVSSCSVLSRVEKTKLIAAHPDVVKHLYVCLSGDATHNCSKCEKCVRTMLALEALGRRDVIADVFDIEIYRKNRVRYMSYMLRNRRHKVYYKEIYDTMRENGLSIPALAYINILPCQFELTNYKNRVKSLVKSSPLAEKIARKMLSR